MPKHSPLYVCAFFAVLSASSAFAYQGSAQITEFDRYQHARALPTIMKTAASCLQEDLNLQNQFIKKFGISAFYGDNSSFAKKTIKNFDGTTSTAFTTDEEKRAMLRSYKLPEFLIEQFVPRSECPNGVRDCPLKMQPTSCIGLALKCLGKGFRAAGQAELWGRIESYTLANGAQGDVLQLALQQLGWQLLYWNPDTSMAREWDLREQQRYPGDPKHIWGQHEDSLRSVMGPRHRYLYSTVDDWYSLVDFGETVPNRIRDVPFFVGIAHLGYHVFPGSYGQIIEGHSTRLVTDKNTLQTSPFSPLMPGGGPRGGPYKSGLVAIPPGY